MKRLILLISSVFLLAGCIRVETAPTHSPAIPKPTVVTTPPEIRPPLVPVVPQLKLNAEQQKYLDESLPPKVREILEKAAKFELLAETGEDTGDWQTFAPNRVLDVIEATDKREILEALYHDAAREDSPAVCYFPRHLIRATYQDKTVEVEICFSCSRFFVRGDFGKFEGTLVRENRKSEELFRQIIEKKASKF